MTINLGLWKRHRGSLLPLGSWWDLLRYLSQCRDQDQYLCKPAPCAQRQNKIWLQVGYFEQNLRLVNAGGEKKTNSYNTWMKKSLGFPTSDLQRSPRKSDVRYLSSTEPSVPKNTPSSPWLSRTQTKDAEQMWSSFDTEGKECTLYYISKTS